MIYTSKRRKFKDFLKTRNWSYYFIFLVLFATVMTCVFIGISKADKNKTDNPTTTPSVSDNATTSDESNPVAKGNYKICINLGNYQVSIYEWDQILSEYNSTPVKYMPAGINIKLTEGEYTFNEEDVTKSNWYTTNSGDIYRYYTAYSDDFIFHTARYQEHNNKNSLDVISYNTIGKTVNTTGITLLCSDAKWIYENCSSSSVVYVYNDSDEPVSELITKIIPIPDGLSWDPSDTSNGSTFCPTKVETIKCLYDYVDINQHANVDFVKTFVKATDEFGNDISSYVFTDLKGYFDDVESIEMNFYVADLYGNVISDSIIVNVIAKEETTEAEEESTSQGATEPTTEAPSKEQETTTTPTEVQTEPVTLTPTEPMTEPMTEPPTEPPTEPVTEPSTEPVTEETSEDYSDTSVEQQNEIDVEE